MRYLLTLLLAGGVTWGTAAQAQWVDQELDNIDLLGLAAAAEHRLEAGEYEAAAELAETTIERVQQEGGRYHPRLIDPLTVRGRALHGMGRYDEAIETFARALHIDRIDSGLHNAEQVEIVYHEAESWVALEEIERADERYQYALEVLERAHGKDSPDLVPGLFRLAEWHLRTHSIYTAREHYERALEILRDTHAEDDPRVIPALRGLAYTYRRERLPPFDLRDERATTSFQVHSSTRISPVRGVAERRPPVNRYGKGEQALREIVKIRESDPDSSAEELAAAYLDLADWNLIFERFDAANTLYRYARRVWLEHGGDLAEINAQLEQPRPIYRPVPNETRESRRMPELLTRTGHITLRFSVDERGRTYDVETLDAEPAGQIERRAQEAMRASIYRPRLTEDGPQAVEALTYRHSFKYVPDARQRAESLPDDPHAGLVGDVTFDEEEQATPSQSN